MTFPIMLDTQSEQLNRQGNEHFSRGYYQEVLELQKIQGDERGIGTTLANLGNLRADAGEWDRARAYYLEALDIMQRSGDHSGMEVLFSDLGLVARETGQYDEAMRYYEQSLSLMRRWALWRLSAAAFQISWPSLATRKMSRGGIMEAGLYHRR